MTSICFGQHVSHRKLDSAELPPAPFCNTRNVDNSVVSASVYYWSIQGFFQRNEMFLPYSHSIQFSIVRSLCDQEVAFSPSDRQPSNLNCVSAWRTVPSAPSHQPEQVILPSLACMCTTRGLKLHWFFMYSEHLYDLSSRISSRENNWCIWQRYITTLHLQKHPFCSVLTTQIMVSSMKYTVWLIREADGCSGTGGEGD